MAVSFFKRFRLFAQRSGPPRLQFRELPYRLIRPSGGGGDGVPLIVYLHGAGGAGVDNEAQLERGNGYAVNRLAESGTQALVVAPQCPRGQAWWSPEEQPSRYGQLMVDLVTHLLSSEPVDASRVALVGVSMGGHGVWDLGWRFPQMWAGLMPVCGAVPRNRLGTLVTVPIWCFHGELDQEVPVEGSRQAINALRSLGAQPRYTELPGVGHSCTREVFCNDQVPLWLISPKH